MNSSAGQIMPMMEVGDLSEIDGEVTFDWEIKNFESLPNENVGYASPRFYFSGACWRLEIFPNGQAEMNSEGFVDIYLCKLSSDSPVTLNFSLGFKVHGSAKVCGLDFSHVFFTSCRHGHSKLISRSNLLKKKSLLPSGVLTLTCVMKNFEPKDVVESHFNRLLDLSDNLKDIYQKGKNVDFTVKVQDGENIGAHRAILETRSPIFAAMLSHNSQESQTNEVSIKDFDKSAMDNILCYMYSGDISKLTAENALSVYAAAEKYDMKYVKKACVKFIMGNLFHYKMNQIKSVEWMGDIIKFAELYNEEELRRTAIECFLKNADEILDSDKWKSFINENPLMGNEILSSIVKHTSKNYSK